MDTYSNVMVSGERQIVKGTLSQELRVLRNGCAESVRFAQGDRVLFSCHSERSEESLGWADAALVILMVVD